MIYALGGFLQMTDCTHEVVTKHYWRQRRKRRIVNRVAWLALDEGDSDLGRFLAYFITALSRVDGISATFGESARQMLQSTQPPSEDLLVALLNDVAAIRDRVIFVLDDYHSLDSGPIDQALTFLLEHIPPQIHLVVATREDPHLPLARLRASGQLTELRATDLRFTAAEAAEFLTLAMGLNLTQEEIAALESRTEGWIAGLQLAAISMRGSKDTAGFIKSFAGSHRFVLDYLIEEVLQQQAAGMQRFLLQTAILDRMTGALCDAVCFDSAEPSIRLNATAAATQADGAHVLNSRGQTTLEQLEQANLFVIPLDEERHWYRYHHLFADLLRLRLRQTEPDWEPLLHQRASVWYEQNGFSKEAVDHALHGKDFERAAHVIEEQMEGGFERIDQATLARWLAAMPEEFVFSHPPLTILHAWHRFNSGQLDAAARSLQRAEELLAQNRAGELLSMPDELQPSRAEHALLMGKIAAIRSFLASFKEDTPLTIAYAHQAIAHLPEQEPGWRSAVFITLGDAYVNLGQMTAAREARANALTTGRASGDIHILMIANLRLAEILRQQGELRQVIELCERQFKQADDSGISESAVVGWLLGIWGEALAERNHLSRAVEQVQRGVELAALGGDVLYVVMTNLYLVRVLFSSGDMSGAQDVVDSMDNAAHAQDFPRWILRQFSAWQIRIWLAQDKLESASQWARKSGLDLVGEPTYAHEMEYTALARILIAQGRLDEAEGLLQRLHTAAEAGGRTSAVIEILILQARAAQTRRDMGQAIATLETALSLAEAGRFRLHFC